MHLTNRTWGLIDQELDPPRLCSTEVMKHAPATRVVDRVFRVRYFSAQPIRRGVHVELAVRVEALPVFEQPWRSRIAFRPARPENAHLTFYPVPRNSAVVRRASRAGATQFLKNIFVRFILEIL